MCEDCGEGRRVRTDLFARRGCAAQASGERLPSPEHLDRAGGHAHLDLVADVFD